jgi:hypothetical protein
MAIIGSSGTGKTNTMLNLLSAMPKTFNHVVICCKSKEEPLYLMLEDKLKDQITFYEGIETIPSIEDMNMDEKCEMKHPSTLIVFDDLVTEKKQKVIEDYFIRGRKKGFSMIYISQSYFAIPKLIRDQLNYLVVKRLSNVKNLGAILKQYSLDITLDQLKHIYADVTKNMEDFLLIDIEGEPEYQFRRNLG